MDPLLKFWFLFVFSSVSVPIGKIYDRDQERYASRGLHFRHTDNINHWLKALKQISFPTLFVPETTGN
jgi:hypothetical protein